MIRVSGPEAVHSRARLHAGQRARRSELRILLLVAIQAFHRSLLALSVLRLVAIHAGALRRRGIVKGGLELGLHGRRGDGRVTRAAQLLRRSGGLLRAAGVVTHVAGRRALCGVLLVFELHAAQSGFHDEDVLRRKFRRLRGSRRLGWRGRCRRLRRRDLHGLGRGGQGHGARRLGSWRRCGSGNRSGLRWLRRGGSLGSSGRRAFFRWRRRRDCRLRGLRLRGSRSRLRRGSLLGLCRRRLRRLLFLLRAADKDKGEENQSGEASRDDSHARSLLRNPEACAKQKSEILSDRRVNRIIRGREGGGLQCTRGNCAG